MQKVEKMIDTLFKQYRKDIQKGYDLPLQLIMFFDDKWLLFPDSEMNLDKPDLYFLFHAMVDRFKPPFYAAVSDTNVRDPITSEIVGEQILAAIYSQDGAQRVFSQPYVREDGRVRFTDDFRVNEEMTLGGAISAFYQESTHPNDPNLINLLEAIMEHEAKPYDQPESESRHDSTPGLH